MFTLVLSIKICKFLNGPKLNEIKLNVDLIEIDV